MELHQALDTHLGAKEADTMMNLLPASDWNDVATKTALEAFRHGLEDRMDVRFEAVERQIKALDVRFDAVDRRFESLDARMDARFGSVDRHFDSVESAMRSQTRTLLFGMIGAMAAYALLILWVLHGTGRF